MSKEFNLHQLKKEYPGIFEELSLDFLEFLFSEKTSSLVAEICLQNGVEDEEKIKKIAYYITLVLLNQIPKENLTEVLINGIGLNFTTASRIFSRVNQSIFLEAPEILSEEVKEKEKKPVVGEVLGLKRVEK